MPRAEFAGPAGPAAPAARGLQGVEDLGEEEAFGLAEVQKLLVLRLRDQWRPDAPNASAPRDS